MVPRVRTGYTDEQAERLMPMRWPEDRDPKNDDVLVLLDRLNQGEVEQ